MMQTVHKYSEITEDEYAANTAMSYTITNLFTPHYAPNIAIFRQFIFDVKNGTFDAWY